MFLYVSCTRVGECGLEIWERGRPALDAFARRASFFRPLPPQDTRGRPLLLVCLIQVTDGPQPVEGGRAVAEHITHCGKPFRARRANEWDVPGYDFLGAMVELDPFVVVQFLARFDIEMVHLRFPCGRGFILAGMPQVQFTATVPDVNAVVWLGPARQSDDGRFPVMGLRQPIDQVAVWDQCQVRWTPIADSPS